MMNYILGKGLIVNFQCCQVKLCTPFQNKSYTNIYRHTHMIIHTHVDVQNTNTQTHTNVDSNTVFSRTKTCSRKIFPLKEI